MKDLRSAMSALECALRPPTVSGGSYWPARKWLTNHGVYHDDLNELAVLYAVAQHALTISPSREDMESPEAMAEISQRETSGW